MPAYVAGGNNRPSMLHQGLCQFAAVSFDPLESKEGKFSPYNCADHNVHYCVLLNLYEAAFHGSPQQPSVFCTVPAGLEGFAVLSS